MSSIREELYLEEEYDIIEESFFKTVKDLRYNKEKFDNKEINLCFVTGFSGSGKSTLGAYLNKEKDIEHVDMDLAVFNFNCNDPEKIAERGTMYKAFFETPKGKAYHESKPYAKGFSSKEFRDYTRKITIDFFEFAKQFAASHKKTRFVLEGVWLYRFIEPDKLKDYAVYIKGTAAVESSKRAVKRDWDIHMKSGGTAYSISRAIKKVKTDLINMPIANKCVEKYIKYFTKQMELTGQKK